MASLQIKNGKARIQFAHPLHGRQTLRLGKIDKATAKDVKIHVERLLAAICSGIAVNDDTRAWLGRLSDEFHSKLAALSLVEQRGEHASISITLGTFIDQYITTRAKLKPNTLRNLAQSRRILCSYFGADRDIQTITSGDADDYREALLRDDYSVATTAREIKRARQFFAYAKRKEFVAANPFEGVKTGKQTNRARLYFVDSGLAARVLEACPDNEWRLIFALSRYQGLRCPSETLALRWSDVHWGADGQDYLIVRERKTAERVVPIFPETRRFLLAAQEAATNGEDYVIRRYRGSNSNLRTQFLRILEKASISPWPRPFHNLRSSRQTELMDHYPAHAVQEWIGNSEKVAREHYLQITSDLCRRATQNATHQGGAIECNALQPETRTTVSPAFAKDTAVQIPPRGVEPRFSD
jgi:integrase